MAEVQRQRDGLFCLSRTTARFPQRPTCAPSYAKAEMEVFLAILGEGVIIERAEHILAGARRCVYRIRTGES